MDTEVTKEKIILRTQQRLVTWVNTMELSVQNKKNFPEVWAHTAAIQDLETVLHPKGEQQKAGKYN